MVKETIRVYARVKPLGRRQQAGTYSVDDEGPLPCLEIAVPRDLADGFINNKRESYKFKFQKIFGQEAKQEVIFDSIAKPVAEWYVVNLASNQGEAISAFVVLLGGGLASLCVIVKVD